MRVERTRTKRGKYKPRIKPQAKYIKSRNLSMNKEEMKIATQGARKIEARIRQKAEVTKL